MIKYIGNTQSVQLDIRLFLHFRGELVMNILVIGNGFDLAHGLPTKYTDFLFFCNAVKSIIKNNDIEDQIPKNEEDYIKWLNRDLIALTDVEIDINQEEDTFFYYLYNNKGFMNYSDRDKKTYNGMTQDFIRKFFFSENKDTKLVKETLYLISDNFWLEYFLQCDMHGKENWIDFESEISKVIRAIDDNMKSLDEIIETLPDFIKKVYIKNILVKGEKITYRVFRDKLLVDLNGLIRAFEIYLTKYIEKIEIKKISPDIGNLEIDHVLSFNYTHTYEKVYGKSKNIEYDYIHGEADINHTIETNNMVLGIDEYLGKKKRNKQVEFIAFKKYYQRIHKQTGCKYKIWLDKIRKDYMQYLKRQEEADRREYTYISDSMQQMMNSLVVSAIKEEEYSIYNLYIFGHSLDITDKDILRDLILNDNVHTTIFYHDKDAMGQQIANLVKVIEQDELIRRTGGNTKTIEFKLQQPMIPIDKLR